MPATQATVAHEVKIDGKGHSRQAQRAVGKQTDTVRSRLYRSAKFPKNLASKRKRRPERSDRRINFQLDRALLLVFLNKECIGLTSRDATITNDHMHQFGVANQLPVETAEIAFVPKTIGVA